MRINSVSFKMAFMTIVGSLVIIISVLSVNLVDQQYLFRESLRERSKTIARTIDAFVNIDEAIDYTGQEKIITVFNDFIKNSSMLILQTNIESITINLVTDPDGDGLGTLHVVASTNPNLIGNASKYQSINSHSYNEGMLWSERLDEGGNYLVIMPFEALAKDGQYYRIGTYELIISMEKEIHAFEQETQNMILSYIIILITLAIGLLIAIRTIFVKPIRLLRDAAKDIGEGNLDKKVEIKSKDELGDLADAFNKMAKDLKESRIKIEDYNEILEKLLDQKDEFIGQLGHDLKNPLQPLVGLLPILIEQEKNPKTKETLEVMNKNAEYMRDLISNTLQLAKLRSSKIKFDIENVNLKDELDYVIASQNLSLKENEMKIENKINKNIIVQADKLRLAEIFKNLISNAIKYKADKNGKIIIDATVNIDERDVTISVSDNGIGMTKDQLKKIFDEFYKADRFSNEERSSGLGLAIVKRIVESHGGHIWVDSAGHGRGSTFYFTLKIETGKTI